MKFMHHITIRLFAKKEEADNPLEEALQTFIPEEDDKNKLIINKEDIPILEGSHMKIFSIHLEKERHTKHCIMQLKKALGETQCAAIAHDSRRVDEQGILYIRIDKDSWLHDRKAILVDHGNCLHFSIMLACYPKNKERAIQVQQKLFTNTNS